MSEAVVFSSPEDFRRVRDATRAVEGMLRSTSTSAGRGEETLRAGEVVLQVTGAKDSVGAYPCKLVESPLPAYGLAKEYADATGLPVSPPPPPVPPTPSTATWTDPEVAHTGYVFEINNKDLTSASGRNRYKGTLIGTYLGKSLYVCDRGGPSAAAGSGDNCGWLLDLCRHKALRLTIPSNMGRCACIDPAQAPDGPDAPFEFLLINEDAEGAGNDWVGIRQFQSCCGCGRVKVTILHDQASGYDSVSGSIVVNKGCVTSGEQTYNFKLERCGVDDDGNLFFEVNAGRQEFCDGDPCLPLATAPCDNTFTLRFTCVPCDAPLGECGPCLTGKSATAYRLDLTAAGFSGDFADYNTDFILSSDTNPPGCTYTADCGDVSATLELVLESGTYKARVTLSGAAGGDLVYEFTSATPVLCLGDITATITTDPTLPDGVSSGVVTINPLTCYDKFPCNETDLPRVGLDVPAEVCITFTNLSYQAPGRGAGNTFTAASITGGLYWDTGPMQFLGHPDNDAMDPALPFVLGLYCTGSGVWTFSFGRTPDPVGTASAGGVTFGAYTNTMTQEGVDYTVSFDAMTVYPCADGPPAMMAAKSKAEREAKKAPVVKAKKPKALPQYTPCRFEGLLVPEGRCKGCGSNSAKAEMRHLRRCDLPDNKTHLTTREYTAPEGGENGRWDCSTCEYNTNLPNPRKPGDSLQGQ